MTSDLVTEVLIQRLERIENLLGITEPVPAQEELERHLDDLDFKEWRSTP